MANDTSTLLDRSAQGDPSANSALTETLYRDLRELARRYIERIGPSAEIQPTALVHEAYLKLVDRDATSDRSRTHFRALAAVSVRHALIDHLRAANRQKRGGEQQRIDLSQSLPVSSMESVDLFELNDALTKLEEFDPRAARVVEHRFFGGLTESEIAVELGVSERTVRNDWTMARAWLRTALAPH